MSYGWVFPYWTGDYALDEIELGIRVACHLAIVQAKALGGGPALTAAWLGVDT